MATRKGIFIDHEEPDISDTTYIAKTIDAKFRTYLATSGKAETLPVNIAARFGAIASFTSEHLVLPGNTAYMFLFVHQLLWEKCALKYADDCGVGGKSPDEIKRMVNTDLRAIMAASMETPTNVGTSKVCPRRNKGTDNMQRSMLLFIDETLTILRRLCADDAIGLPKCVFYKGILLTQMLFEQVAKHRSYGMYSGFASVAKDFFTDAAWGMMVETGMWGDIERWNEGVNADSVQPYVMGDKIPNVLSIFHVAAQSILHEHVSYPSPFKLTGQPTLTMLKIESAWDLPPGYLTSYSHTPGPSSRLGRLCEWAGLC